jgi:tRNA-Thr(GGU) m(6)t(6)A37 methyltransferase TsaA
MPSFRFDPIGVARTPYPDTHGIPRQGGGPARIEIFPPFVDALDGLNACSHLWIIGFFHHAQRDVLRARPRKTSSSSPPRGVFGMRAPVRPNPLGLTCSRILELHRDTVVIDRLDFQDQTPIVDIKPYSPGWDLVPSARSAHRYDPSRYTLHELVEALSRDAENALGPESASASLISSTVLGLAKLTEEFDVDLRDPSTRFAVPEPDGRVDLLLCATGASFGTGRLLLRPLPVSSLLRTWANDAVFDVRLSRDGVTVARDASPLL